MIESADGPTSLPYGMVITHILKAHNIFIPEYSYVSLLKSYNSREFASMVYMCAKGS